MKYKALGNPLLYAFVVFIASKFIIVLETTFCITGPCIQPATRMPLIIFVKFLPTIFFCIVILIILLNLFQLIGIGKLKRTLVNLTQITNRELRIKKRTKFLFRLFLLTMAIMIAGYCIYKFNSLSNGTPELQVQYPGVEYPGQCQKIWSDTINDFVLPPDC
jgi:hypothetical protein